MKQIVKNLYVKKSPSYDGIANLMFKKTIYKRIGFYELLI